MPGILPMKVIRVGSSAQSRIAQACDRCRSKKIRCDGIRPTCTQCANVGFECKTSDKLSRRAFPRGYTESLEDRVRGLEAEVRELKQLLDEKDEKIDMLSRIHSFSSVSRKSSGAPASPGSRAAGSEAQSTPEEALEIVPPTIDLSNVPPGTSSAASFIECFKSKVASSGKSCSTIKSSDLKPAVRASSSASCSPKTVSRAPPRLLSDQYVNIFFQEWAPLFPIINRTTFIGIYEDFVAEPESSKWQSRKHDLAQLYLVFDIAALAARPSNKQNAVSYELEWRKAMQGFSSTASVATLQCHILAELLYLLKEDQKHFLRQRASGVTMCHQLGLHRSQESLSLSPMEKEARKRLFWAQYVVDTFGSSTCGVPMLLRDSDISTEYAADVDDENITSSGFQPSNSGEVTKMSNFIALTHVSRILSRVVESLHRPAAQYSIPISKFTTLTQELDRWVAELPGHLRLKFENDKPSTGIISDRSPLLSLAEFYIRLLINRPLVAFASGNAASAAVLTSANAAKHIGQICDLLDERSMNYTFPVSKGNILLIAGFSLLWQSLDLPSNSKLVKDNHKSLALISRMLYKESDAAATEFAKIMGNLIGTQSTALLQAQTSNPNLRALHPMPAPHTPRQKTSTRDHLRAIAARFSGSSHGGKIKSGDTTPQPAANYVPHPMPQFSKSSNNMSRASFASVQTEPGFPSLSPATSHGSNCSIGPGVNLDFFHFSNDSAVTLPNMPTKDHTNTTWEQMLANIDSGDSNIYNTIYGGFALPEFFPSDGPLNLADIDPSVLSATIPSTTPTTVNPTPTPITPTASNNNTKQTAYFPPTTYPNEPWPNTITSPSIINTNVSLHDIQSTINHKQALILNNFNLSTTTNPTSLPLPIPPQSVLSYTPSEEDSMPTCSSISPLDDYASSAVSTSVYDGSTCSGGNRTRKATSVSSITSGGGCSGMKYSHQHRGTGTMPGSASTFGSLNGSPTTTDLHDSDFDGDTTGLNEKDTGSSSAYGGILIPNEYGIGF